VRISPQLLDQKFPNRKRREVVDEIYSRMWKKFREEGIWPGR